MRAEQRALADGGGLLQQMFPQGLYVESAGVRKGELDPFAVAVMDEIGLDISTHKPTTFEELEDWEGLNFDLIVTLSPEAHHKALELTRTMAVEVEYWPTPDPTGLEGNREQMLAAYRDVRDGLMMRIRAGFPRWARRTNSSRLDELRDGVPRMLRSAPLLRRGALLIRGPHAPWVPAQRRVTSCRVASGTRQWDDERIEASPTTCSPVVEWHPFR